MGVIDSGEFLIIFFILLNLTMLKKRPCLFKSKHKTTPADVL